MAVDLAPLHATRNGCANTLHGVPLAKLSPLLCSNHKTQFQLRQKQKKSTTQLADGFVFFLLGFGLGVWVEATWSRPQK